MMFPKAIVFDMDADLLAFFQESSELLKIHAIWNEIRAMMIRVVIVKILDKTVRYLASPGIAWLRRNKDRYT